jgi:Gas vesicle protein G
MGVMKEVALLPVAPLRLTVWVASKVAEQADREHNSPEARVRRLREIEVARARGDLSDERAAELEALVLEQASGSVGYRG